MNVVRIREADCPCLHDLISFRNDLPTVGIYVRVSTEEQAKEHYSLATQEELCLELCKRKFGDGRINTVVFCEEGRSGKLPYYRPGLKRNQYRPALSALVEAIRTGRIQYMVVYRADRIARSVRVWTELYEDVIAVHGVTICSCTDPLDAMDTSGGQLLAYVIFAISETQRKTIVSNVTDSLHARRKAGYTLGKAPYGWLPQDKRSLGRGKRPCIERDRESSENVRWMIESFICGRSITWICRDLNLRKVPSPSGDRAWGYKVVRNTILNPVHYGLVRNGKDAPIRGLHYEHRLFDESTYAEAVERYRFQTQQGNHHRFLAQHLLGGIARCSVCGKAMRVKSIGADGVYYLCHGSHPAGRHTGYRIPLVEAESVVLRSVATAASNEGILARSAAEARRIVEEEGDGADSEMAHVSAALRAVQRKIDNWSRLFNDGKIEGKDYESFRASLHGERVALESRQERLSRMVSDRPGREARLRRLTDMLRQFDQLWEGMDVDERRAYLSEVVEWVRVEPKPDYIQMTWKLVLAGPETHRFYRYGKVPSGPESLPRHLLTHAYYLAQGWTPEQIAVARDISVRTSRAYMTNILACLGTDSIQEALRAVARRVATEQQSLLIGRRGKGFHHQNDFTERDIRLLELLAKGDPRCRMAEGLAAKEQSVRGNLWRIYRKLGVHSAREAVAEARRRQLIPGGNEWSDRPTGKQQQVLDALASAPNQRAAAEALGITLSALKERVRCMLRKLHLSTTEALLALARERGWIG